MKKHYLVLFLSLIFFSGYSQKRQLLSSKRTMSNNKVKNYVTSNRATNISRWVSYQDTYSGGYTLDNTVVTMVNGAITSDSNIHQYYNFNNALNIDTAFIYSTYSLVHLGGYHYSNTWFNANIEPFDTASSFDLDSIYTVFNYKWVDTNTIDTLVVRISVPSATQASVVTNYDSARAVDLTGDTLKYLVTTFDQTAKKIENTVAEIKFPLTKAFVKDPNNWVTFASSSADSNVLDLQLAVNEVITGHNGYLIAEVSYLSGRTLTAGVDTIGVNANWFSPTWRSFDNGNNNAPPYEPFEFTCGGVLFPNGYFDPTGNTYVPHWRNNNASSITENNGETDPFESPYILFKIAQTNTLTASISELETGVSLSQNYPNPTDGFTTINYALENASNVSFEVMDVTGKVVASSYEGNKLEGTHSIELNTNSLNTGIYFYSIVVDGNRLTKKMTISK